MEFMNMDSDDMSDERSSDEEFECSHIEPERKEGGLEEDEEDDDDDDGDERIKKKPKLSWELLGDSMPQHEIKDLTKGYSYTYSLKPKGKVLK
jgi:hypothetical protein